MVFKRGEGLLGEIPKESLIKGKNNNNVSIKECKYIVTCLFVFFALREKVPKCCRAIGV